MQTLMSGHQQSLVTKVLSDAKLNIQDNPSYECRVNALWSKGLQEAEKQGKSLFDGPILRLHAVQTYAVKKQVHLHIAPSSYRYFFAAENIVDNRQKCETIWQQRVVPVGSQTYLLTKNDDVILFKRSAKLSIAPEMLRGLGGTSDLAVDCVDGKLDFQKTAFREASEELLVPLDNIGLTKQCFNLAGFILNSKYWMGTAIYWAKTNLNANQAADLPMDSEHTQVQVVPKHYLHQFTRQLRFQDRSLSYYLSLNTSKHREADMIDSVQILHRPDQHDDPQPPQLITLNQPFSPSKELMHQIDARWDKISHQSKRKGRHWYNGKIWSPLSANTQYIQVRHAMFKDFIGTRHLSSNVAPVDRVSTVSVAVLPVEVEDNPNRKIRSINLFRRRKNSLDFGGYFSGLGGLMEPEKDGLNPVSTAIREVKEECGLLTTPDNYVYLGTAITTPEHSVTYCYLLELSKNTIAKGKGFVFEDAEMTHNIRLPTWILGLLRAKLSPAAPWVKQYAQLIIDQHKHRL